MPVKSVNGLIGNNYQINMPKVKKNTFETFVPQNSLYPQIPLNISKAYTTPQVNPEYKVLETFKLPNTGIGKVYELRNGHKVIILPKKGQTTINTYVGAGWNNESPNKREVAHLLEHLLATRKYKKNSNELEKIYDELSLVNNASTWHHRTMYYSTAPIFDNNELKKLINYQSEMLLKPDFDENDVKHEQKTITEELLRTDFLLENFQNSDCGRMREQTIKNLFGKSNPLAQFDISKNFNADEVNKLTKDDLIDFYEKYYTPDNMYTSIVGNVDDSTIKMFGEYFGKQGFKSITELKKAEQKFFSTPLQHSIRTDINSVDKTCKEPKVEISILKNSLLSPQEQAHNWMIDKIIDNKLEQKKITHRLNYYYLIHSSNKQVWNMDLFSEKEDINEEINQFYNEINSIIKNGFTPQDILYAQNLYTKNNVFDDEMNSFQLSNQLCSNLMYGEDPARNKFKNYIYNATPNNLYNSFIKNYDFNKASLVVVHPTKKQNDVAFKGTVRLSDIIKPEEYTLPNNVHVLFDESDDILKTTIKYSLFFDPISKVNPNIIPFIAKKLSENKINDIAKDIGFDYRATLTNQKLDFYFNGKNINTLNFIDLGINEIINPSIGTREDFECWKSEESKNLKTSNNVTQKQTKELFKDAPWVINKIETSSLTFNDILNFHKNLLTDSQLSVLISVPKSASPLYKATILNKLAMLPAFKPYNYSAYFNAIPVSPIQQNKVFIEKNDHKTIDIMKSYKIIKSGNIKDLAAINVLNFILGRDSNGHLFKLLRNEKNITYGAYSELLNNTSLPNVSRLNIWTTTSALDTNNLKTSVNSFDKCIHKLQTELVDTVTLEKAKRRFRNTIYNDLDFSFGRNNILDFSNNSFYGKDFISELEKAIDDITPYDIREIAKYYLSQPTLYTISGNKEAIEANKEYLKTLGENEE